MTADMVPPSLGLRGVKLPVVDLEATRSWYSLIFGWETIMEFPDSSGVVQGAAGRVPGPNPVGLSFRANPGAVPQEGLELAFDIETRADLEAWLDHLDRHNVQHSPIIDATVAWLVVFKDPDGHEIHLMTREKHGIDQTGRPGYGRTVAETPAGSPAQPRRSPAPALLPRDGIAGRQRESIRIPATPAPPRQ